MGSVFFGTSIYSWLELSIKLQCKTKVKPEGNDLNKWLQLDVDSHTRERMSRLKKDDYDQLVTKLGL